MSQAFRDALDAVLLRNDACAYVLVLASDDGHILVRTNIGDSTEEIVDLLEDGIDTVREPDQADRIRRQ